MIADPPSDAGNDHASATDCDDGVAVSASGTEGTLPGTSANDAEYANESEDGDDYVLEELAPVPWNPVLVPAPLVSLAFPKVTNRVTF